MNPRQTTPWRGLEELADTDAFREMVGREFPRQASEWTDPVTRRRFLTLMGASLALAGLSGCSQAPPEPILPYTKQPEGLVLGKPLFYATAMPLAGVATGLLVEQHEGRPTKVEGNPTHSASLGATDSFAQASVLSLYDPDRSRGVTFLGQPRSGSDAASALRQVLAAQRAKRGSGLRLLTEAVASPTLTDQIEGILKDYPEAKWVQYEPTESEGAADGARLAFGEEVNAVYDLEKADVILSLDDDFLACGGASLRLARQFALRRKVWDEAALKKRGGMNRLYAVESTLTTTGAAADHRVRLRSGLVEAFARAVAAEILDGLGSGTGLPDAAAKAAGVIARDLLRHRGRSVVLVGPTQPAAVHALGHALNAALGNVGPTVTYTAPLASARAKRGAAGPRELTEEMRTGAVDFLLILGGNPVYTAPADLDFPAALRAVSRRSDGRGTFTAHLSLYEDETSVLCQWHLPEAHFLESWGDARTYNGAVSLIQPLIAPLFGGRSAHEILETFTEGTQRPGYEIVRAYWNAHRPKAGAGDFEAFWRRSLHDGVIDGTALPARNVAPRPGWAKALPAASDNALSPGTFEIAFRTDPTVFDGRFANNAWLQELPKPISRLTWDGAALVSPKTAERLGLNTALGYRGGEHGDIRVDALRVTINGRSETFPAWVVPGHADDTITLPLGYGRTRAGQVGNGRDWQNAYRLRTSAAPWLAAGATVEKTGERTVLACVQAHHSMESRNLVRAAPLDEYRKNPHFAHPEHGEEQRVGRLPLTMYREWDYPRYKWGMAIDLGSCVGCNACVVACQAENNIPVVGKEEVTRGREMHWLRVDRYFDGGLDDPKAVYHEPVPCMHCENAPCELVCPVEATSHSHDGLNEMTYNRCVGTRFCSNNCPYKVRRFNFLQYADFARDSLSLGRNPDVTVRSRGVMEKCTYCVQRVREAEIEAEKRGVRLGPAEGRVRDGEILTACQAVCPTQAIVFGDVNDEQSLVAKMKASPLDYGLLADLNTLPRTTYLAAVKNPNPDMKKF